MVKYASNIYDIIDLAYYPSKIFAMAPYTRKVDQYGSRIYTISPFSLKQFILSGGMCLVLMVTAMTRILLEIYGREISFAQYVQGTLYILMQMENMGKVVEILINQKYFIQCLNLINKSDEILRPLGISISYKLFHIILILIIICFPIYNLFMVSAVWEFVDMIRESGFTSQDSLGFFFQLINSSIVYIIRNCSMYCHMCFIIIMYERFRSLNDYLSFTENENKNESSAVKFAMNVTRDLHNILYKLTLKVNKTFAWAVFDTITMMFLEIIAVVVTLRYSSSYKPLHGYLGGAVFVGIEIMVLMVFSQRIKSEAGKTRRLLSDMTLPHFDKTVTTTWITALFQLLHENIELSACGFYSLDMTVITSHIGTFCTITMFFLKIHSNE